MSERNWNGYHPSPFDARDYVYHEISPMMAALPMAVDLIDAPVQDQGKLGSCFFNGETTQMEYMEIKDKQPKLLMFSRLFAYYIYRTAEGDVPDDTGAYPRVGLSLAKKYGVCLESTWPYDLNNFVVKPPQAAYDEALKHKITNYYAINSLNDGLNCIASGYPFGIGVDVYASFDTDETAKTGMIPIPKSGEKLLGGHYMVVVGYNRSKVAHDGTKGMYKVQNSWGTDWGLNGFCWMPFAYIHGRLCSDRWTVRGITE